MISVELIKRFDVEVELTRPGTCLAAVYQNDAEAPTFQVSIPSAGLFVAPPIQVKEVDDSTVSHLANKNFICKWFPVAIRSIDGTVTAFTLDEFPEGARINALSTEVLNPDGTLYLLAPWRQQVRVVNAQIISVTTTEQETRIEVNQPTLCEQISAATSEQVLACLSAAQQNKMLELLFSPIRVESSAGYLFGEITIPESPAILPDISLMDNSGPVAGTFPAPAIVQVVGDVQSATHSSGTLTIVPGGVSPTNVIPRRKVYPYTTVVNHVGDLGWHWGNGTFNYNDGPGILQELDPDAGSEFWFRLKHNNIFGNKYRLTDDQGVPAPSGRFDFAGDTVVPNSVGATPGYFIDHLTGDGYAQYPVANGKGYIVSLALAHEFTLNGYTGFRAINEVDVLSLTNSASFIWPFSGTNADYPFTRGGTNPDDTFDPTPTGSINTAWLNRIISGRGRNMRDFRLQVIDTPLDTSANHGTYAVRKHF